MKNPPQNARAFAKWLNDQGACSEALKWQSGKSLRENWDSCERGDWLEWLLNECGYQWTAPAEEAYQKAKALAQYERVTATAWAEYQRVKADTIRTLIPYPFK